MSDANDTSRPDSPPAVELVPEVLGYVLTGLTPLSFGEGAVPHALLTLAAALDGSIGKSAEDDKLLAALAERCRFAVALSHCTGGARALDAVARVSRTTSG